MSNDFYDIIKHSQPVIFVSSDTAPKDKFLKDSVKILGVSWADILEFDPTVSGVKELRTTIAQLGIKPHSSKWRILVIKNADYMNDEQANTLLKTLEEPPHYGRLIIFARNFSKLLPTIKSRCHRIFSANVENENKSLISLDINADFSQFLKQLSVIEGEEIPGTLELIFMSERDKLAKGKQKFPQFYRRVVESYISSKSTNVNRKLLLENLWVLSKKLDQK